jgi:hypothetical protein
MDALLFSCFITQHLLPENSDSSLLWRAEKNNGESQNYKEEPGEIWLRKSAIKIIKPVRTAGTDRLTIEGSSIYLA